MNKRIPLALALFSQVISSCAFVKTSSNQDTTPVASTPKVYTEAQRAPSSELADTPWTTWSEKGKVGGLIVLKGIREGLLKNNLHDPHVAYSGYAPVDCSKINTNFRSADGTCNDLKNPLVGAANTAFGRNVAPAFIVKNPEATVMVPNPSVVSQTFFTRDEFKPVPFLNMLAAVWIQFMNHDWLTHGKNMETNPWEINVGSGRQAIDRTKENTVDPKIYKREYGGKVTLNDVTHWWDASQIYGSSQAEQNEVRAFSRGKMRTVMVGGNEVLPKSNKLNPNDNRQNQGYEVTGFKDNWWVGLSMLHTLFVKEHNAIADMLLKKNVTYDAKSKMFTWKNGKDVKVLDEKGLDEQLFQTARLINAAILAKIHTVEWTPGILANDTLKIAMNANWYGLANPNAWTKMIKRIPGLNKTDWFGGTKSGYLIGGIVGDKTDNFGVPYSITEEFTSVYRLHSLLPETLELKKAGSPTVTEAVPFAESRNDKSYAMMENHKLGDLYYSFGTQLPGQLVLNNFPLFMQNFTVPGHGSMDLGMVDVLRDRERGVPRYNQFRRGINLKPIKSYRDFFPPNKQLDDRQMAVLEKFNRVYGKDSVGNDNVEAIDLLVGTLAEEVRPKNFGFGETMFQIFILMASRRLMADRFFTVNYTPEYYTKAGLAWIDDEGTLGQVIVRHMPELKKNVQGLETAFLPWKQ
ncbi:peroxidase family protein [Bdellovibrio sp. HCB337]|uniref:peroxidase family protein n=1 Tax=Bdellovibrio sp. HCB337 TaxID=3394358 RepID=UPI0039A5F11E